MSVQNQGQCEAGVTSFLEAGFRGWAWLLGIAGAVLLVFCGIYSVAFLELETFTLAMGAAAFVFSGTCWLFARLARR